MSGLIKVLLFSLAIVGLAVLAVSCGNGNAQYRVVNAIANTDSLATNGSSFDITMNGTVISSDGLSFPGTIPSSANKYNSVSAGGDTLDIYQEGQAGQTGAQPLLSSATNLTGGKQYTVLLTGNSTAQSATYPLVTQVITDTNPTPTSGNAGIRIIDVSLTSPSIDVYAVPAGDPCCAGTQLASGLEYPTSSGSGTISTGYTNVGIPSNPNVKIFVTVHGNQAGIITTNNNTISLTAGQNYTLVLVDANGGGTPPQFVTLQP